MIMGEWWWVRIIALSLPDAVLYPLGPALPTTAIGSGFEEITETIKMQEREITQGQACECATWYGTKRPATCNHTFNLTHTLVARHLDKIILLLHPVYCFC